MLKLLTLCTTILNAALSAFLYANMASDVKNLTSSVDRGDGLGLLKKLQSTYAPATPADRSRAYQQLHELKMHPNETAQAFISQFRRCIQVLSNTTIVRADMPDDSELARFFIDKLYDNTNLDIDIRFVILDCRKALNSSSTSSKHTLTYFEDQICYAEMQAS
jgi:hypothetical protein